MAKLTIMQRKFVDEYLVDFNATQAAIRAGYSETSAGVLGSLNLKRQDIRTLIDNELMQRYAENQVTVERIREELGRLAFDKDQKTSDRIKALELLGRHLGMFIDRVDASVRHFGGVAIYLPDNNRGDNESGKVIDATCESPS